MKKTLVTLASVLCVSTLVAVAQDASTNAPTVPPSLGSTAPSATASTDTPTKHGKHAKRVLTPEQKTLLKEMLEKYDANKDGKLEKKERAKMTKEDKEKCKKAGLFTPKKGEGKKSATK